MRLNCLVGYHKPLPAIASNQGFHFSSCRRCGRDLVRTGRAWRRVPKGFRVVWKARDTAARPAAPTAAQGALALRVRRVPGFRRLEGLVDLVGAALRVLLWALRDRWQGLSRNLLAAPLPVLRLPAR
jgi:hypothetical protein